MKILTQFTIFLRLTKPLWLTAILGVAIFNNAFAQGKCPRVSDRYTVNKMDPTTLNNGKLLIVGVPLFIVTDIIDLTIATIPSIFKPIEINLDVPGGLAEFSTITSFLEARALGWKELPYKTYLVDNNGNGCRSIILSSQTSNGPSYLIKFDPVSGMPMVAQSLTSIAPIFSSGSVEFIVGRLNGDGRDDLTATSNGVTLAVLTAQANGTYAIDPAISAQAVWRAFGDAVKAKNKLIASSYFVPQYSSELTAALDQNINDLAITLTEIVAMEAVVRGPEIVEIKIIVKSNNEFFAHLAVLTATKGVWKIDAY